MAHDTHTWQFWIDVGGTFADCVSRRADGQMLRQKVLSSAVTKGAMPAGNLEATATLHGQTINERYEKSLERNSVKLDYWEKKHIAEGLRRSQGDVPAAARLLGIGRATLYRKISEYNIPR